MQSLLRTYSIIGKTLARSNNISEINHNFPTLAHIISHADSGHRNVVPLPPTL